MCTAATDGFSQGGFILHFAKQESLESWEQLRHNAWE